MKLYNRTRIPNPILEALLVKAGRSVGARTGGVVVQVNRGQYQSSGVACRCDIVRLRGKRWINTDGGYFKVTLPLRSRLNCLNAATTFLRSARHEWAHIRDFQACNPDFARRTNGRRPPHDSRPEEIRAENAIWDSDHRVSKNYFDDVVLDLAIAIEQMHST